MKKSSVFWNKRGLTLISLSILFLRLISTISNLPSYLVSGFLSSGINFTKMNASNIALWLCGTGLSRIQSDEKWCSFFSQPDYINADTNRVSRATKTGYWKLTGKGCKIKAKHSKAVIGSKRILVFYERPGGSVEIRTDWVMHQFSIGENPLYKVHMHPSFLLYMFCAVILLHLTSHRSSLSIVVGFSDGSSLECKISATINITIYCLDLSQMLPTLVLLIDYVCITD